MTPSVSWRLCRPSWRTWLFRWEVLNSNWISKPISDLQAVNQKAATQNEKTEKLTVIQKLEEAEQELKVIIVQKNKI